MTRVVLRRVRVVRGLGAPGVRVGAGVARVRVLGRGRVAVTALRMGLLRRVGLVAAVARVAEVLRLALAVGLRPLRGRSPW